MLHGSPLDFGLLAIHISDGLLTTRWSVAGFALASVLISLALFRIDEKTIVRVGVLTAVFFVASQFHIRVGVGTVHLILNGMIGVLLRRHAPLAIAQGLLFQSLLFGHGGLVVLGVNICVLSFPALMAGYVFPRLVQARQKSYSWITTLVLVLMSTLWILVLCISVEALIGTIRRTRTFSWEGFAAWWSYSWWVLLTAFVMGVLLTGVLKRFDRSAVFACGVAVGLAASLATVLLNATALLVGGQEDWQALVALVVVVHMPVIAVESLLTGIIVQHVYKQQPEWFGLLPQASSGRISSNGTSH